MELDGRTANLMVDFLQSVTNHNIDIDCLRWSHSGGPLSMNYSGNVKDILNSKRDSELAEIKCAVLMAMELKNIHRFKLCGRKTREKIVEWCSNYRRKDWRD